MRQLAVLSIWLFACGSKDDSKPAAKPAAASAQPAAASGDAPPSSGHCMMDGLKCFEWMPGSLEANGSDLVDAFCSGHDVEANTPCPSDDRIATCTGDTSYAYVYYSTDGAWTRESAESNCKQSTGFQFSAE